MILIKRTLSYSIAAASVHITAPLYQNF